MPILIAPSILNSDLVNLSTEIQKIQEADYIHLDVMDNHFVPNLSFGLPFVERIIQTTSLPADVHLMINNPDVWAPAYAEAGAASVTFHAEASQAPIRLARELRKLGSRAGIAVKPATDLTPFLDHIEEFDMFLIMTVEPGFGGQSFITSTLPKITAARRAINESGRDVWIQVDGGISTDTIAAPAAAGANMFVAGSAVYRSADPGQEVTTLRTLAQEAYYTDH
ncbi:MAG TPA: ribulose-phosphate 3-epimerase [Beutenbergiaceae bacterium]|nr:ribulose-phosphate 3-epimerase [Beutenbergiaceae bacterium]